MKQNRMKVVGCLLLALCLLFCLLGCAEKHPFKLGSYGDVSDRAHYAFLEDGSVEASVIGQFFRGTYEAKDGQIIIQMKTAKGIEVQKGTYAGDQIALEAGEGLAPILLTWDPEANH